jgi:hypothetical protein
MSSLAGGREFLISTQLRLAAGICVLSTGLLIGSAGGAIATADTDTSGSASQSGSVDGAAPAANPASEPTVGATTPTPGSTLLKTVSNTLALVRKLGQERAAATQRLLTKAEATPTENDNTASDLTEKAVTPLASDTAEAGVDTTEVSPDTTEVSPDTTEVSPDTTDVAPATDVAAGSATNPFAPVSTVVNPLTNAVATVVTVLGTVPGVVAGLPTSKTPVADVITSLQEMLTSVTVAVLSLASVASDLYTLLAAGAQVATATATIGGGAGYDLGPVAAADAPLVPTVMPAPQVLPSSDIWAAHGDVAALAKAGGFATAGLSEELSISGAAPLAMQGITPTGVLPVLEHAVRALLVPASLSALAALALPGVGGLLIVCAAGIRIGYRQAKAGLMLRASGIARFAGSGPLGVVRSGSLIALRPRAVRVARPTVSRAAAFLDQAA